MSAFYNGKQTLGVILHEVDDGGGTLLPGDTAVAGKVLRLCGKLDGGVDGSTLPVPEWYKSGPSVGSHPPPRPQVIQDLLTSVSWFSGVSSGGLRGVGVDTYQPLDSIFAPPCEGHNSNYGVR